jgi:hypothetical protein
MNEPPFDSAHQLNKELDAVDPQHFPGYPRLTLDDTKGINNFLNHEFDLRDLGRMSSRLWMMSMQSSANVSALHRQKVKGRNIIITEDACLHLIWYYDRIFIKPLPKYLLSHKFWSTYLLSPTSPLGADRESILRTALGYLRTYFYLVRYESDFRIATDEKLRLIPDGVTWEQFCNFSSKFDRIQDHEVCERYKYGEIRLSRLNLYTKLFIGKRHFQRIDGQYSLYFARFYGPILFAFGVFSILLNAMQLEMAVESLNQKKQWISFWLACRWFSVMCLIIAVVLSLWLALLFLFKFVSEWYYALGDRWKKKKPLHLTK